MPRPTPLDFKGVISDPTATMCGNLINTLLKFPVLFYQWISSVATTDGSINGTSEIGDYIFSASPLSETDFRKLCNGQELVRTDFPELFALIGVTYGTPSSAVVFKLPDRRAKVGLCIGAFPSAAVVSLGGTGGEETHVLIESESFLTSAHRHITGRFNILSNDDVFLTMADTDTDVAVNGKRVVGQSGSDSQAVLGGLAGPYIETGTAKEPLVATLPHVADAHNNVQPWIGEVVYIKCK